MKSISGINLCRKVDLENLKNNVSTDEIKDKSKILNFLKNQKFCSACATEKVFDFFKNEETKIPMVAYETEDYYWDDSDIYYFEKYNLKLNDDFIEYVLNKA